METYLEIARVLLEAKEGQFLRHDLHNALDRANMMCERAGGELHSRQVVAAIIVAWEMSNPDKSALY